MPSNTPQHMKGLHIFEEHVINARGFLGDRYNDSNVCYEQRKQLPVYGSWQYFVANCTKFMQWRAHMFGQ